MYGINMGQTLLQRTHPTGSFVQSLPVQASLSSDRHEMIFRVTVRWTGAVFGSLYETDFAIEVTKTRVRLSVERDTAIIKIDPNQLKIAELEVTQAVTPLL